MLYSTVALSVILSFIGTEFVGILTGGMISAGYLAYYITEPTRVVSTILLAVIITIVVKLLSHVLILYGRRRFVLTVLLSLFSVYLIEHFYFYLSSVKYDVRVIGYIVPGLIAQDMEKQGIIKTIIALITVTSLVALAVYIGG